MNSRLGGAALLCALVAAGCGGGDVTDDRDQEQSSIIFLGDFPRCENTSAPKPFSKGKSYSACLTYLMKGGGTIDEVRWKDGPVGKNDLSVYYDKPIVWTAG